MKPHPSAARKRPTSRTDDREGCLGALFVIVLFFTIPAGFIAAIVFAARCAWTVGG